MYEDWLYTFFVFIHHLFLPQTDQEFFFSLGACAKPLREMTTGLVQYVPLFAWNSATYTRGIFVKFHISDSD